MKIDKIGLGNKIKEIRLTNDRLKNATMEEFAVMVGSNKSNVSRWERGKNVPNEATLTKIAEIGGITLDELVNDFIKAPLPITAKNNTHKLIELLNSEAKSYDTEISKLTSLIVSGLDYEDYTACTETIAYYESEIIELSQLIEQIEIPSFDFYIYEGKIFISDTSKPIAIDSVQFEASKYDVLSVTNDKGEIIEVLHDFDNLKLVEIINQYSSDKYVIEIYFLPVEYSEYKEFANSRYNVSDKGQIISDKPYRIQDEYLF